jgi:hypothetical protein
MPAAILYFRDPDGHLIEFLAMLGDQPRPDLGVVPWPEWQAERRPETSPRFARQDERQSFKQGGNS